MKIIYEWLKRGRHAFLCRVELFSQEDLAKKPEIPLHLGPLTSSGYKK